MLVKPPTHTTELETVRECVRAVNARDREALVRLLAPGFQAHTPSGPVEGQAAVAVLFDPFDDLAISVRERAVRTGPGWVIMDAVLALSWKATGDTAGEQSGAVLWRVSDGFATSWEVFDDIAEASQNLSRIR